MALEGQLKDFNLAEILQLIASQQKSGFLILEGQREMVFIFDKGILISTRDRRSEAPDPLEVYLRNYGFFNDEKWTHIGFVRKNSSLDLTEILISEQLMDDAQLIQVLKSVAVEMAHRGMKLRRGRYHFTATKDTPPGVRGRIQVDVQSLLMEAARRLDEETQLRQILDSALISFRNGRTAPADDALSLTAARIYKLALSGRPLGRIVRHARVDSFTTRETLKTFLDEGWIEVCQPEDEITAGEDDPLRKRRERRARHLKNPLVTALVVVGVLGVGAFRWLPMVFGESAVIGLAAPVAPLQASANAVPISYLDANQQACRDLRLRQVRAEVIEAAVLFHYQHGNFPDDLQNLVHDGELAPATQTTVDRLGWRYALEKSGQGYKLAL